MSRFPGVRKNLLETVYNVFIVKCVETGAKYVSVRNCSAAKLRSMLIAGSKDPNFNTPIHMSFRKHGEANHVITRHSSWTTRQEANATKSGLIEANAKKGFALNAARPVEGATVDFVWVKKDETAEEFHRSGKIVKIKSKGKAIKVVAKTVKAKKAKKPLLALPAPEPKAEEIVPVKAKRVRKAKLVHEAATA
jgi:hypothetical protein